MDSIILVSGGFDPLHSGHIAMIKEASEHGLPTKILKYIK